MTDAPNPDPTFTTRAEVEALARQHGWSIQWGTADWSDVIRRVTLAHLHLGQAPTTQADGGGV